MDKPNSDTQCKPDNQPILIVSEIHKGRPRKYKDSKEYKRACNRMAKFKTMSLEKAKQQLDKYNVIIKELIDFIKCKELENIDMVDP